MDEVKIDPVARSTARKAGELIGYVFVAALAALGVLAFSGVTWGVVAIWRGIIGA